MGKHKVGLQRVLNQHKRAEEARYLPQLSQVYKIIKSIGQNIFECEAAISRDISDVNNQEQKKVHLCELNRKLRNVIWLKRGTFVLVEPYDRAMKIVGEITRVIEKSELKELGLLATSECKNVEQER